MVTLDNFGIFLAGHFKPVNNSTQTVIIKDIAGADLSVRIFGSSSQDCWTDADEGTVSDFTQVGKGTTPATRQDTNIETPFTNSPESAKQACLSAGYNSGLGKITISTVINPTGSSGTITEVVKIQGLIGVFPSGTFTNFTAFFRDIISPVNFISGQAINVSHEVLI